MSETPAGHDIQSLQQLVTAFRDERNWAQFHTPKDLAAAIAVEAAELQELFLWQDASAQQATLREKGDAVRHEVADIVILALAFAEATGIDLTEAIVVKLAINARNYPVEESRGRATKYTDREP